jgi:hypothetical protein
MSIANRRSLMLAVALSLTGSLQAQTPSGVPAAGPNAAPPYECFGLAGVALRNCMDLNTAAGKTGNNKPGASHDCGGMTGAALATCRELNGEAPAASTTGVGNAPNYPNSGYGTAGNAPANAPAASTAGGTANAGTGSSSGSNPTGLSDGSGTARSSSGSNPTGMSNGSGQSSSSAGANPAAPTSGAGVGSSTSTTPKTPTSR